jgi:cyclopropane-fatty-acyl-phospholipid synthase
MSQNRQIVADLLADADVAIDGPHPWDIQVRDDRLFARVLRERNLGLGESYMDGWWDCPRLDEFFYRVLKCGLEGKVRGGWVHLLMYLPGILFNLQSRGRSRMIAEHHYDLDKDLFLSFLDPYNQYSCAYFRNGDDLEQAQRNKLEMICRKIGLAKTDHLLDIGCGWGGFARYASEHYGCKVTAVNISKKQLRYARDFCEDKPIEFIDRDYREIRGAYDKIVSVGMFEHVGPKNYWKFMAWHQRFQKAWLELQKKYDERFKRMWEYYLLSCAGAFRARAIQVWQIVMTHAGSDTLHPRCRPIRCRP